MIKITSFQPFRNLLRISQEFYEDKASVRIKSLSYEREFEFDYKDAVEITDGFYTKNDQLFFSSWLLFAVAISMAIFGSFITRHLVLLRIEQVCYVSGLLLFLTSFINTWQIFIFDKNDNVLTSFIETRKNRDSVQQAIAMIRKKAKNLREFSATYPFPENEPAFEHVDYDILNLHKTTDRFYESEIIGFQKGLYGEKVYHILYNQLSQKVFHGKQGQDVFCAALYIAMELIGVVVGFIYAFGSIFGVALSRGIGYFIFALLGLSLLSWPLGLLKREMLGLYDKNGNVLYWTYINKSNKKKVEKIIEFIQAKISATQNQLLKEQL